MIKIKNALLLLCLFAIGSSTFAQDKISSDELSAGWTTISEENGIIFSVKKEKCTIEGVAQPFTYGFIRIENSTNEIKDIQFNVQLNYTDGCVGCENKDEYSSSVSLKPNTIIETDCTFDNAQLSFLINNPLQLDHKELLEVIITTSK